LWFDKLQVLIFGGLLIRYRSDPLLMLQHEWVFPCGYILAFPSGVPGTFDFFSVFMQLQFLQ